MKTTVKELRALIREATKDCWGGSCPEETYDETLDEDDSFNEQSVYVPDDIKRSIKSWMHAMGLSGTSRSHKRKAQ